jgi:hypothetical protein
LPAELRVRLDELEAKRESEALTPDEHAELIRVVDSLESFEVQRVEKLSRLAALRGISLTTLMQDRMGAPPPEEPAP